MCDVCSTCVWVVETILESRKGRAEGIGKLEEDLVHDQDGFLPEVRFAGTHEGKNIISQVSAERNTERTLKEFWYMQKKSCFDIWVF